MVLADTSVWISHFRKSNKLFFELLTEERVGIHPFVIGELACGHMPRRREVLAFLCTLPEAPLATPSEFLHYIERHSLAGCGIGFVDAHLLASAELMGAPIWTLDKPLLRVAQKLEIGYIA